MILIPCAFSLFASTLWSNIFEISYNGLKCFLHLLNGLHLLVELHIHVESKFFGIWRQITYDTDLSAIGLQNGGVSQVLGGLQLGNLA